MSDAPGSEVMTALLERMAQLELALEDQEYVRLTFSANQEFGREGLRQICDLARVMWLKNPLIARGVAVQTYYVFGQGVEIHGRSQPVDEVVQAFLADPRNKAELTSQQAMMIKEQELQITANLFFVFFTQPANGRTRVRTIPFDEIGEIISNPEDAKEPWYYLRSAVRDTWNPETGAPRTETVTAYYPDWRYRPRTRPASIGGHPVMWETPCYHVKVNCLSDMRFGVSEVYAAIDWARAYKEFLEDWATIVRAYSRFAWQLTVKGGKAGVQAAKTKMASTLGGAGMGGTETNPPPTTGSMFIGQADTRLDPIRTAGATPDAEDGRRLLLMVASAMGLPESFFGDVSVGSLATARSLDRPTELKFKARQTLWAEVFTEILNYVIERSVRAVQGPLSGSVLVDDEAVVVTLADDEKTGMPLDASVDVDFPPILEHDVDGRIKGIIAAATLDGKPLAGTMTMKTAARLLLSALGEDDVDTLLGELFPDPDSPDSPDAPDETEDAAAELLTDDGTAGELMVEAVRELREAIRGFVEGAGVVREG